MIRLLLSLILTIPITGFGQSLSDTLAKDNTTIPLPVISVNVGLNYAFSDVALSNGPSPARQLGYQLTISQEVTNFLNLGFELYTGSVYGEEQRGTSNLNFRTSLVSPRINLEYNLYPLLKPDSKGRQLIRPYLGFGLGMVFFRSKGDLKDANGTTYEYWSNGGVYAEAEGTVDETEATSLERDFEYETDLRDANLDGFRKYSQMAFSLPLNAGLRFQLSKNVGVNAAFSYVFNFTDLIDNINNESVGARQGSSGFDNHLFGSVGVSVFLGRTKPSAEPKPVFIEEMANEQQPAELKSEPDSNASDEETGLVKVDAYTLNQTVEDPLAEMSKKLVEASDAFEQLSKRSDDLVKAANSQLQEIGERQLNSKKELKEAKEESIRILESSITDLIETNTELNEAASKLNRTYTEVSDEEIRTTSVGTEKIETTVRSAIPAVESLKEKVKAAKSPEELRSLMNIASRNLDHTNDIFSEESDRMNSSISEARKTVVQKRTELFLLNAKDISALSNTDLAQTRLQILQLEEELNNLKAEGMITDEELSEIKRDLDESIAAVESTQKDLLATEQNTESVSLPSEQKELASAANELANVSKILTTSNVSAQQTLSKTSQELSLIAGADLKTKASLNTAKESALRLLEASLEALNETNEKLAEATEGLSKASANLETNEVDQKLVTTERINSSISNTSDLIESSRSQIKSSKNAEELKSILNLASSSLDRTLDEFDSESAKINSTILAARKAVVEAKFKEVASAEQNVQNTQELLDLSTPRDQEIFSSELQELKAEGILTQEEFTQISDALEQNEERIATKKAAQVALQKDVDIAEVAQEVNRSVSQVQLLSNQQISGLEKQKSSLEAIEVTFAEAKSKKEINSSKLQLQSELEATEAILAQNQDKLQFELAGLKKATLNQADMPIPALTENIQILESAVKQGNLPLEKLGELSVNVANAKDAETLKAAATELKGLLSEASAEAEATATSTRSTTKPVNVQVLEGRIENLNNAMQKTQGISEIAAITTLQADLQQEIESLAASGELSSEKAESLSKQLSIASASDTDELLFLNDIDKANRIEANETQKATNTSDSAIKTSPGELTANQTRERNIENIKDTSPKQTGDYHWADLNKNDWISPDEVLFFIDLLFEGEAERSVEDIQNLIDYYFDQE